MAISVSTKETDAQAKLKEQGKCYLQFVSRDFYSRFFFFFFKKAHLGERNSDLFGQGGEELFYCS